MSATKLHELKQKRNTIATDMRALHDKIGENVWTEEQRTEWKNAQGELQSIDERIEREESLRSLDQSFIDQQEEEQRKKQKENPNGQDPDKRAQVFDRWMRHGQGELSAEERQVLKSCARRVHRRTIKAALPCRHNSSTRLLSL